jgi:hypothetical protein
MMVEALQDVGLRHFYAKQTGRACLSDLKMLGKLFYARENVMSSSMVATSVAGVDYTIVGLTSRQQLPT